MISLRNPHKILQNLSIEHTLLFNSQPFLIFSQSTAVILSCSVKKIQNDLTKEINVTDEWDFPWFDCRMSLGRMSDNATAVIEIIFTKHNCFPQISAVALWRKYNVTKCPVGAHFCLQIQHRNEGITYHAMIKHTCRKLERDEREPELNKKKLWRYLET